MGISRDSLHKRRATGGKRVAHRKKRKYELGRQPANTKLSSNVAIRRVRTRGGNSKFRALRLDSGTFAWGSEATSRKTRILDVCYNASNNELVRTQTLVKSAVVAVDATPFRQWYAARYGKALGKKAADEATEVSATAAKRQAKRAEGKTLDEQLDEQFNIGRLFALITSRPGQVGRADGYILEGKELEFYLRKMQKKRQSKASA